MKKTYEQVPYEFLECLGEERDINNEFVFDEVFSVRLFEAIKQKIEAKRTKETEKKEIYANDEIEFVSKVEKECHFELKSAVE